MFNTSDKFNLSLSAFDKNNQQISFCAKFPIDDLDNFALPNDTDYISFFQYYETSKETFGNTLFSIHIGSEMIGKEIESYLKNNKVNTANLIGETNVLDFWERRLCCQIDSSTEILTIRKVLTTDDRVVGNKENLKSMIVEFSNTFNEFEKTVAAMKTLGKSRQQNSKLL